jgi:hypothetical protein
MTRIADGLSGVPIMSGLFTVKLSFFLKKLSGFGDEWPS